MRVKKDKAYVVVTKDKERVQGAFPYTKAGKKKAREYCDKLNKKDKPEINFKVKVV
tara:strand:+ start:249 stop:416 length:168 start_codon:yes stop_codon:yes gene_type:complete